MIPKQADGTSSLAEETQQQPIKKHAADQIEPKNTDKDAKKEQMIDEHQAKQENSLENILNTLHKNLEEDTKIQAKITAFKSILQKIQESKIIHEIVQPLCSWLLQNKITDRYLHDDSHTQILRKMPLITKFLYENKHFSEEWILNFVRSGCASHDQYLKTVQCFIHFLRLKDLQLVFKQLIVNQDNQQNPNLPQIIHAIINNKQFAEGLVINEDNKQFKQVEILKQLQNQQQVEIQPLLEETQQIQFNQQDAEDGNIKKKEEQVKILAVSIFQFLVDKLEDHLPVYIGNFNKLISSKYQILSQILLNTLINLLKDGKVSFLWILQHVLKMDFRQSAKNKELKNPMKVNFIQKLVNEGLYEYTISCLAINRFNKQITDKALNIIILLSKNFKPLQSIYTEYIWKVVGLHSRDEKQREQFFGFVRQSLRNESSFTEQSVVYIYFQVLMKLDCKWFSLRILECLELLFMRLNEDLKNIAYNNSSYSICNPDLIGLQKFWYIYFYTNDSKVFKKCKQLLWKLATYRSQADIKIQIYEKYLNRIIRCMTQSEPEEKKMLTIRGFQIIDKMLEEGQKKESSNQYLQLNIRNETTEAMPPKNFTLTISQKSCLSHLRQQISQQITPSVKNIQLLQRGAFLKGQKMTLKQLSIQNGQTIMVSNQQIDQQTMKRQKQLVKQNQLQLIEIFGSEIEPQLLSLISEKMEGQNIEKIMNSIMDENKMQVFREQFETLKAKQKQKNQKKPQKNLQDLLNEYNDNQIAQIIDKDEMTIKEKQNWNFSKMLSYQPQNLNMLLRCAQQSNYLQGWQTLKKIPICNQTVSKIKNCVKNQQWNIIFPKGEYEEMLCISNAHILKKLLNDNLLINYYMFEKKGIQYILSWLLEVLESKNTFLIQSITQLIKISLYMCKHLELYHERYQLKVYNSHLLNQLIEQSYMETDDKFQKQVMKNLTQKHAEAILSILLTKNNQDYPFYNLSVILLFYIYSKADGYNTLLKITNQQMYSLLTSHDYAGEYLILYSIAKWLNNNEKKDAFMESMLDKIKDNLFKIKKQEPLTYLKPLYDICTCILKYRVPQNVELDKAIIKKSMETISQFSLDIISSQFSGLLQVLRICLHNLYANNTIQNTPLQDRICQFAEWLFSSFLFELSNPHRLIRQKEIRKYCYQIFDILTNFQEGLLFLICQKVINIQIQPRPKNEDYLDFRKHQFLGLTNLGATCYINSLLQQVYHTKFSKLLLQEPYVADDQMMIEESATDLKTVKMKQLKKVFMQLYSSIKNVVNPINFIKDISFYGQPINTSVQQDASEFLLCLFDSIQTEGYSKEIYQVFGGNLCNEITAHDQNNSYVKNNIQHFNSVGIDIKGKKNLQQALAYFIKPQNLDGQNMYYCQELGKKTKATKRTFIENMPNILLITLKRFEFDYQTQSRYKLNDYFEFPFQLDMHKYSAAYIRDKNQTSDSKYKLSGILVHSGSAQSGHYYSYIKVGEKWYEFNDKHVSQFNINSNLKNQCFGCAEGKKNHNAYMLFYEKIDSNYHGVYLNQIPEDNYMAKLINSQNSTFLKNRLVYDENFMAFIEKLYQKSMDQRVNSIRSLLSGKKSQAEVVHFDFEEENKPLLDDQIQAKWQGGGGVDDFLEFDPPSAF